MPLSFSMFILQFMADEYERNSGNAKKTHSERTRDNNTDKRKHF